LEVESPSVEELAAVGGGVDVDAVLEEDLLLVDCAAADDVDAVGDADLGGSRLVGSPLEALVNE
jgi:hypothetical protein